MKIVNKKKFMKSISILILILIMGIIFANKSYSNMEVEYKEEQIISGDTLWKIAQEQVKNNKYYEKKDVRYVVFDLKEINNLDSVDLKEGQKINIPRYK